MQNTKLQSIAMSILTAGLLATLQACSSSSSSPSCNEVCIRQQMCQADASTATATTACNALCSQATMEKCTNASAMQQAFSGCLGKSDCTSFNTCFAAVPTCEMSGGNGGNGGTSGGSTGGTSGSSTGGTSGSGTGGATGAGGAGATASCSVCDKANTCCQALATLANMSTASCTYSTATCNGMSAAAQPTYAGVCQAFLTEGAAVSSACK